MGRRILAIAAAAVIALIGAVLVLLYARGADSRAVAAASPTTVYVSNAAVPAGTSLKEALRLQEITQTQVPARSLPAGALTTVDDSNSALVALDRHRAGPVRAGGGLRGDAHWARRRCRWRSGKLAVSLTLSDPARVGRHLRDRRLLPHPLHDLQAEDSSSATEQAKAFNDADVKGTSVLLDNVKVIAMGARLADAASATTADRRRRDAAAAERHAAVPRHRRGDARSRPPSSSTGSTTTRCTPGCAARSSRSTRSSPTTDLTMLPGLVK